MHKTTLLAKFLRIVCLVMVLMLTNSIGKSQTPDNQTSEQHQREVIRRLAEDSPIKIAKARHKSSNPTSNKKPSKRPDYTLVSATADSKVTSEGVNVGFTFWVLKDASPSDSPDITEKVQRKTKIKSGNTITEKVENVVLTPKRVNSTTNFSNGDLLRFSLDLPIDGYIYIFNREKYTNGTLSEPYLIFPRQIDKGKSDKTMAGKLLFIPNLIDSFEIEETSESNKEKAAEVYYILVSPKPLPDIPLLKTDDSESVSLDIFKKYEKFSAPLLKFESQSEADKAITKIEKLASIGGSETLAEDDPLPQTIYHIIKRSDEPIFFSIAAEIGRVLR